MHMTKSVTAKSPYPPLEGEQAALGRRHYRTPMLRIGYVASRNARRGGVIVHPQPIHPDLLAAPPTPALWTKRASSKAPTLPLQERVREPAPQVSYAIALSFEGSLTEDMATATD